MGPELWPTAGLLAVRIMAVASVQPLWRAGLGRAWLWVSGSTAVLLAVLSAPVAGPLDVISPTVVTLGYLAVWEVLLGLVIGALAGLPAHAFIGASVASATVLRTPPRPFTALATALVLSVGLALGVHHGLLELLEATCSTFAVGRPTQWAALHASGLTERLVAGLSGLLALGLAFATPVLLAQAVVRTLLGLVGAGQAGAGWIDQGMRSWAAAAVSMLALGTSWAVFSASWARALWPSGFTG